MEPPPPPKRQLADLPPPARKVVGAGVDPEEAAYRVVLGLDKARDMIFAEIIAEIDPQTISLRDMKDYFQAKKEQQNYLATKVRNLRANEDLVKVSDVERVIVNAFKAVSHYLDNLPDILERDGYVKSSDVDRLLDKMDDLRSSLTESLSEIVSEAKLNGE